MKTLIIYASKTGTTKECAYKIKDKLKNSKIFDINSFNEDVNNYDLIVVGSPIRIGMIDNKIKKFLIKNKEILKSKKIAFYMCCGFSENYQKYFKENFLQELLDIALIYDTFGGQINLDKQKGFDKFIIKLVSKKVNTYKEVKILNENIDKFIIKLKNIM